MEGEYATSELQMCIIYMDVFVWVYVYLQGVPRNYIITWFIYTMSIVIYLSFAIQIKEDNQKSPRILHVFKMIAILS